MRYAAVKLLYGCSSMSVVAPSSNEGWMTRRATGRLHRGPIGGLLCGLLGRDRCGRVCRSSRGLR